MGLSPVMRARFLVCTVENRPLLFCVRMGYWMRLVSRVCMCIMMSVEGQEVWDVFSREK